MLKIGKVDYFYTPREKVVAVSRSIGLFQEAAIFLWELDRTLSLTIEGESQNCLALFSS